MITCSNLQELKDARGKCLSEIIDCITFESVNCSAIDMGIGSGVLAIQLKKKFIDLKITGIDKDISYISQLLTSSNISDINLLEEDILDTSLADNFAEIVLFFNMIRHLPKKDLRPALLEAKRVLSQNGNIYIFESYPQPSTKAQDLLWDVYCLENELEERAGNVPEAFYQPDEIKTELYQIGFLVKQISIFDEHTISLPPDVWENKKKDFEEMCQNYSKDELKKVSQKIQKLDDQIKTNGLESLPTFVVIAYPANISMGLYPYINKEIKWRVERDNTLLLYSKVSGLVTLDHMGGLIWSLSNGERNMDEIADEVYKLTSMGDLDRIRIDIRAFFLQMYQQDFISFHGTPQIQRP